MTRRVREGPGRLHVELPRPWMIRGASSSPTQQGVPARRLVLEAQVGVVHRPSAGAPRTRRRTGRPGRSRRAPRPTRRKARSRRWPRDRRPAGRNRASWAHWRVGERGDVGQDQGLEAARDVGVEQAVVDHLEGDAGLDERLVPAERRVLDPLADAVAAVEPRGLLRVDEPHPGQRALVAQVPLGSVAPGEDLLDGTEPARVVQHARELREPGPHAVGDAGPRPRGGSRPRSARSPSSGRAPRRPTLKMPPTGLPPIVARYSFAFLPMAQGAMSPRRACRSANSIGARSPMLRHVQAAGGAAAGVGDEAGVGVDLAQLRVPEAPQGEEPLLAATAGSRAARRPAGRAVRGQVVAGGGAEAVPAVLAVAHAGAGPAVDEDAVHLVAGHDLPLHLGHELEVVGAQAAGDPHLRRGPVPAGLPVGVHRDPVRVRRLHVVVGGVRIGAGDDDHARARGSRRPARRTRRGRPATRCGGGRGPRSGSRRRSRRRSGRRRRSACA